MKGNMKTDFLRELGIEQEAINKIMAENGKDIEALKAQVSTLETEKANLSAQLTDANTQIERFKDLDIDGIKAAADDWKGKYEAAEAKAKADVEKLQFDHALSAALSKAKARDNKAVSALLDMGGLKLNNGEIVGLDQQLEMMKKEKSFLFEDGEGVPAIVRGTSGGTSVDDDAAVRAIMGLPEKK